MCCLHHTMCASGSKMKIWMYVILFCGFIILLISKIPHTDLNLPSQDRNRKRSVSYMEAAEEAEDELKSRLKEWNVKVEENMKTNISFPSTDVTLSDFNDVGSDKHHNNFTKRSKRKVNSTDSLSSTTVKELKRFFGCETNAKPPICSSTCLALMYRPQSGVCNNDDHPLWGAAYMPLSRWRPAVYENRFNTPLGWDEREGSGSTGGGFSSTPLPNPRNISNVLVATTNNKVTDDSEQTSMVPAWGQYIAHDISYTPQSTATPTFQGRTDCKTSCDNVFKCFPIKIPKGDLRISRPCLPYVRSSTVCGTGDTSALFQHVTAREQINIATSFIDGSAVYGSSEKQVRFLRNLDSDEGLLKVNHEYTEGGFRNYLPFDVHRPCVQPDPATGVPNCFLTGDPRASDYLTLSAIHTMWLREHNRLARQLKNLNPHWSGEIVFQEARKIVGAYHQIITYKEYLPNVLGPVGMTHLGVYNGYKVDNDSTASNVFATAAIRFTDLTVPTQVKRFNSFYQEKPEFPSILLHESFSSPWRMVKQGGLDPILRGLIAGPAKRANQEEMMHDELREKFFSLQNQVALDLATIIIQRGRDHGIPSYNNWREECGLSRENKVIDLNFQITNSIVRDKLKKLYGSARNIDAWIGMISEDLETNTRLGPVLSCLISRQFKLLRDGDKFYYENQGVFTPTQQTTLNTLSMARLICDNTGIKSVPKDVFRRAAFPAQFLPCNQIPSLDLGQWVETSQVASCGIPRDLLNGYWRICNSQIIYQCNHGYELVGSNAMECIGGVFAPASLPVCKEVEFQDCRRDNGGCEEVCDDLTNRVICSCRNERILASDGQTCLFVDEADRTSEKETTTTVNKYAGLRDYTNNVNYQATLLGVALVICIVITLTSVTMTTLKFNDSIMLRIWELFERL